MIAYVPASEVSNLIIYNDVDLSPYMKITDIRGRGLIQADFTEIVVPGRPGSYFVSKQKPKRILENDYKIIAHTQTELRQKIDELNAILDVDGPVPIVYADEPDKTYYGIAYSDGQEQQILSLQKGTLVFVCFDPYKYGPTRSQTINDPSGGQANPIIINEGTAETYPTFTAYVQQPITFLDIISPDSYMRVGQPYSVDQTPVDGDKPVMQDEMESLTGWGAGSGVVDGIIQGSFQSDGSKFTVKDYGPAYDGWAGPALKKSLPNPLQDFRVHALIDITSSANGVGRIEVYGLDTANNIVFRMSIGDFSTKTKDVKAFWELGPSTDNIFTTYGKKTGSLNDYYGSLVIERKGNRWHFYTAKRTGPTDRSGTYVDYVEKTFVDTKNQYTAQLAQIQVHIGSHLKYTPIPTMSINHVFVYDLHNPSTDQVPYIAYPGDVLQFDHKAACIYKNGDIFMSAKDFGASFFLLGKGETELAVNPNDAAIVTVDYRPRWY